MISNVMKEWVRAYGPDTVLAYVRWTPSGSATQTITGASAEACGVKSVTRSGAGAYVITFADKPKFIIPIGAEYVENDTTTYHFARVESTSIPTSGPATATVSHKSVAFASVASGPAGSDTVDELCFAFALRMSA